MMDPFRAVICSLFLCALFVRAPRAFAGSFDLRLLTYNIKGLPPPLAKDQGRFKKIGDILNARRQHGLGPHVVFLQEAFSSKSKKVLRYSDFPYLKKGPSKTNIYGKEGFYQSLLDIRILNSGLYALSELPIHRGWRRTFGPGACVGFDCFANKGMLIIEVEIPGAPQPLTLITTHLNANGDFKDQAIEVRKRQIKALKTHIDQLVGSQRPYILAGDFNIKPSRPHFRFLASHLESEDVGLWCFTDPSRCLLGSGTDLTDIYEDSVDRHLFHSTPGLNIQPIYLEKNFRESDTGVINLSDHDGLEVHYRLTWSP